LAVLGEGCQRRSELHRSERFSFAGDGGALQCVRTLSAEAAPENKAVIAALKSVRENRVVPPGLQSFYSLNPPLKALG